MPELCCKRARDSSQFGLNQNNGMIRSSNGDFKKGTGSCSLSCLLDFCIMSALSHGLFNALNSWHIIRLLWH